MTDSIGARLRQARELRRLSLQQASETTKVRPYYLQALENDDYSAIPSAAQARGFLRIYAEFLELDPADLIPLASAIASSAVDDVSDEVFIEPARPTLWDSLRERFSRRGGRQPEPISSPADLAPEAPAEPAEPEVQIVARPASSDAKTARRSKDLQGGAASDVQTAADVKKNAVG